MLPLLLIAGSYIIDIVVVVVVCAVLWWIIDAIVSALGVPPYPANGRKLAWAIFALAVLVFCLYRYLGVHLP